MRVLFLWVLATWCAECAWGGFTVVDYPVVVLFLGPLYGSAAVLIREVARRRGGGWPVIVLLAAAFGLVQAGAVDQTLFDRAGLEGTEFAEAGRAAGATLVPGLGFSAEQLFDFVGGHVWVSICAPIALVEACVGADRRRAPWLGGGAAGLLVVLYAAGSLLIWSDAAYVLTGAQIVFVTFAVVVLVVVALCWVRLPRRGRGGGGRSVVGAPVLGVLVLAGHVVAWFYGSQWLGMGLRLVTLVVVAVLVVRWACSERHVVAAWGAGLVAAAVAAFLSPPYEAEAPWLMLLSDVVGAVVVVGVLVLAYARAGGASGAGRWSLSAVRRRIDK